MEENLQGVSSIKSITSEMATWILSQSVVGLFQVILIRSTMWRFLRRSRNVRLFLVTKKIIWVSAVPANFWKLLLTAGTLEGASFSRIALSRLSACRLSCSFIALFLFLWTFGVRDVIVLVSRAEPTVADYLQRLTKVKQRIASCCYCGSTAWSYPVLSLT